MTPDSPNARIALPDPEDKRVESSDVEEEEGDVEEGEEGDFLEDFPDDTTVCWHSWDASLL
jgi:hypothetical protein